MKQSVLDNMERIIEYMGLEYWKDKSLMLSLIDKEEKTLLAALSRAFIDLAVESFNTAEAKYIGYVKLVENRDKPEMLDSILKEHTQLISEAESKRKEVEERISELLFLLEDFRDRILETSNIPKTVPTEHSTNTTQNVNCA